jgi:hypothetical protein
MKRLLNTQAMEKMRDNIMKQSETEEAKNGVKDQVKAKGNTFDELGGRPRRNSH